MPQRLPFPVWPYLHTFLYASAHFSQGRLHSYARTAMDARGWDGAQAGYRTYRFAFAINVSFTSDYRYPHCSSPYLLPLRRALTTIQLRSLPYLTLFALLPFGLPPFPLFPCPTPPSLYPKPCDFKTSHTAWLTTFNILPATSTIPRGAGRFTTT